MITPIFTNIYVELIIEDKTWIKGPGGDVIKTQAKEPEQFCKVLAVGEQVTNIKPGDIVLVRNTSIGAYMIDDKFYAFLNSYDVLATLTAEAAVKFRRSNLRSIQDTPKYAE